MKSKIVYKVAMNSQENHKINFSSHYEQTESRKSTTVYNVATRSTTKKSQNIIYQKWNQKRVKSITVYNFAMRSTIKNYVLITNAISFILFVVYVASFSGFCNLN